jgi:hypothetical protein
VFECEIVNRRPTDDVEKNKKAYKLDDELMVHVTLVEH